MPIFVPALVLVIILVDVSFTVNQTRTACYKYVAVKVWLQVGIRPVFVWFAVPVRMHAEEH